jgi:hypothetical protein
LKRKKEKEDGIAGLFCFPYGRIKNKNIYITK